MILEAPMGEGKTEAALLAAELLSRHGGQDGVFVALPTQATSDPMYDRVCRWVETFDDPVRVGLLHGKRMVNAQWRDARSAVSYTAVDEYGVADPFAEACSARDAEDWFLGNKRGLLQAVAVGTIDQVLHAATRTKHVMLRHAGLAGGVLVVDEVHAYDVYMSQFLCEALRWAGAARVPVVLLSATLPPAARRELVSAYAQGQSPDAPVPDLPAPDGYPAVLSLQSGAAAAVWHTTAAWRPSRTVAVSVLEQGPDEDSAGLVALLAERLAQGGTALIVRNTVARARETYLALRDRLSPDVRLLHARMTTAARVERAEELLRALGPSVTHRPARLVVVATQVAEQSFDIDADLVVSDLAPVDLLLQRAGRLHRHDRSDSARPLRVRDPELVVTGVQWQDDGPPALPGGSKIVYGEHLLLRAAHLVHQAGPSGWVLPTAVPALVEAGYARDDDVPAPWRSQLQQVRAAEDHEVEERRDNARAFLLAGPDALHRPTLAGLHDRPVADVSDEEVRAVVRDGDESLEVVLVVRTAGGVSTLSGRPLGPTGAAVVTESSLLDEVVASGVRLPPDKRLTQAAQAELAPLAGWTSEPYLRRARALVLDEQGSADLAGWRLRYDGELGLLHEQLQ